MTDSGDVERQLDEIFMSIFPFLSEDLVRQVSMDSTREWDSLATLTLISLIEEDFGPVVDAEAPILFRSYRAVADYLHQAIGIR